MTEDTHRTFDRLFDALSHVQRRRILVDLMEHHPQSVSGPESTSWAVTDTQAVELSKRHVHLPKLEDYGFIEWDRDEQEIVKGPQFETVRSVVESLHERRDELPDGWV